MTALFVIACFVGGAVLAALVYEVWFYRRDVQANRELNERLRERNR